MTRHNYTPDNANEWPKIFSVCGMNLYRRYAAVYEVESDGSIAWWTHGVGPGALVYDPPGQCTCITIGVNPLTGEPIQVCHPPLHAGNPKDYVGSDGNTHYFIGFGGSTPPNLYLLSNG